MGAPTTKMGLYKPNPGESGYAEKVNANFDKLDVLICEANDQTEEDALFAAGALIVIRIDLIP